MEKLLRFLDYYAPSLDLPEFEKARELKSIRMMLFVCFFAGTFSLFIPVLLWVLEGETDPGSMASMLYGFLALINPFILRKSGRLGFVRLKFFIESGAFFIFLSALEGGLTGPPVIYLLTWILGAGFILGRGLVLLSGIISFIAFLCFFIYDDFFLALKPPGPTISSSLYYFVNLSAASLTIVGFIWGFENFVDGYIRQIRKLWEELQIANQKLKLAKEDAIAANQAKSAFLANMSHEIRTPLNGVLGMADIMHGTTLNSDQEEMIRTIINSGDSLLSIINDILDFSKIEAGKLELEHHPFDLRVCVEEVVELLAPKAYEKGLEVVFMMPEEPDSLVMGDVTRLKQILMNLIGNAIKFTGQGEVVIKVERNSDTYTFHIKDSGIGIPKNRIGALFQSFSQVDVSTTRKFGGSGLGLAISKKLTELMGGEIWVKSEEGVGSTFSFTTTLPEDLAGGKSIAKAEISNPDSGKGIMWIENKLVREGLQLALDKWRLKVKQISSLAEIVALCEKGEKPAFLILDLATDKLALESQSLMLKKLSKVYGLKLIFLSSPAVSALPLELENLFFKVIAKPVRMARLRRSLQEAIHPEFDSLSGKTDSKETATFSKIGNPELRILIAEDNLVNQKVISRMIQKLGYEIHLAANGLEVLQRMEEETYDLILMDIQMPKMDGLTASKHIRSTYTSDRQPIIVALTANAMAGDREKYLQEGMDDYLSKPIKEQRLRNLLEKMEKEIVL